MDIGLYRYLNSVRVQKPLPCPHVVEIVNCIFSKLVEALGTHYETHRRLPPKNRGITSSEIIAWVLD
ncbi:hypothetical protein RSOLAG1IB_06201 [Rhizoctonia solani AG-1 IB]|uniref:Uncharacterized protein n=1 Tax=Thanatephorus cucumeris (strain AG1-IB / isolate 7/3/14) TaxID=1108050 RepID=A0A0B7F6R9_THACB|nr:hypothetical protein RSOLAG1IB_06201 [Rhizoctonia solani AG-1 IB]